MNLICFGKILFIGSLRRNVTQETERLRKLLSPSTSGTYNNYNTVTGIGALDVYHEAVSGLKRVASHSSIATLTGGAAAVADGCPLPPPLPPPPTTTPPKFGTVYQKVWIGLSSLERDPFPGVASLAAAIILHVRDQVCSFLATIFIYIYIIYVCMCVCVRMDMRPNISITEVIEAQT